MSITLWFSAEGSSSSMLLDPGNATSGSGPGSCFSILDTASVELLGHVATCKYKSMSIPRGLVENTNAALLFQEYAMIWTGYYIVPGFENISSCSRRVVYLVHISAFLWVSTWFSTGTLRHGASVWYEQL